MASESPSAQRKNRAPRQRQGQDSSQNYPEVQSDSNLLIAHTPKPKKHRQRQNDNRAASGSEAPMPRTTGKPPRPKQTPGARDSSALQATPAKNFAYASAAFNNSPAASSLPMPKFLSKSVPAPAAESTMQARLDQEPGKPSNSPSPPSNATPEPMSRMKSPLEMFFNADRQEKAKKQTINAMNLPHDSPFLSNRTPPTANKDMFMLELDNAESPAAARPARPDLAPRMSSAPGPNPKQHDATAAATQSLKDFLKLSSQQSTPPHPPSQPQPQSNTPAQPYLANPFMTTPQQHGRPGTYESPLHYGNRNLSPLFQAARTPNGSHAPAQNESPLQNRTPMSQSQPFDPRAFLDQHARSSSLSTNQSFPPVQAQPSPAANHLDPRFYPAVPNGVHASPQARAPPNYGRPSSNGISNPSQVTQNSAENSDMKDMEARLRNILKLE